MQLIRRVSNPDQSFRIVLCRHPSRLIRARRHRWPDRMKRNRPLSWHTLDFHVGWENVTLACLSPAPPPEHFFKFRKWRSTASVRKSFFYTSYDHGISQAGIKQFRSHLRPPCNPKPSSTLRFLRHLAGKNEHSNFLDRCITYSTHSASARTNLEFCGSRLVISHDPHRRRSTSQSNKLCGTHTSVYKLSCCPQACLG